MGRLDDKVAIITGAASGMGEADAQLFAREGASVLVTDLRADGAARVADELTDQGLSAASIELDVTDARQWDAAVARALELFGRVGILVNNAGLPGTPTTLDDASLESFQAIVHLNLDGQFLITGAEFVVDGGYTAL